MLGILILVNASVITGAKLNIPNTAPTLIIKPASKSIKGLKVKMAVAASPNALKPSRSSPKSVAKLPIKNIILARTTEGVKPANRQYSNRTTVLIPKLAKRGVFNLLSKKVIRSIKNPICKPDTAKICAIPAAEKDSLTDAEISFLSPVNIP